MSPPSPDPIRVFVVEDHQGGMEALAALLERTPEGDLTYVGGLTRNTPELLQCVRQSRAQVVLLDLVLSPSVLPTVARQRPEIAGVAAIEALRRHGDAALKIVAYSNWADLRLEALDAGADAFLLKTATADELRLMLRHVMERTALPPLDTTDLGRLVGLELFPTRREFLLRGDRCTDALALDAAPFALLHYLALERQQGAEHWVERRDASQEPVSRYSMTQPEIWQALATYYEVSPLLRDATLDTSQLAQWTTKVNRTLRRWHTNHAQLTVIRPPGTRKARGVRTHYTLHPALTRQGIVIHDGPCALPGA
jgi:DNA-binding NarL/FixJ family response regulator